jgi:DNA-directed RNA polymerase subunit beta|tara:strand:- start:18295 stop:22005 length:3711 start_codon:yes stop_codon:yes gene_type:complete
MNKIFLNNIGDLGEAQRASFYHFLSTGISEELANFPNPFIAKIKVPTRLTKRNIPCFVYLYTNDVKLKGPNYSIDNCLKRDTSYTIQLYIPGEYSYSFDEKLDLKSYKIEDHDLHKEDSDLVKKIKNFDSLGINQKTYSIENNFENKKEKIKKIRIKQDIFFGEIPLMTEEGTFVISGCERVIISQIIRSPGIYFRKEFGTTRKTNYTATIISNKGLWTRFVLDTKKPTETNKKLKKEDALREKDRIYIKLNDFKSKAPKSKEEKERDKSDENKLFIYDLINYFGLNFEEVWDSLKYPLHLNNHQFTRELGEEKVFYEDEIPLAIKKLFFNQKSGCFSIGEIGRYKINKKLGLNLPKEITYLTSHDFIGIIDGLIELKYYDRPSDDIDHIKNKQIRCIGELLQNQIRVGFYRLQKSLLEGSSISKSQKLNFDLEISADPDGWLIDPRPVTIAIKEFFKTSQLSQFMDQVNPLAELTHKRRISVFGPNGLKRDHISTVIRDIHPSQYGRLCPIETPEGQNAGLITSVSMFGRISALGWIETPYFLLKDKQVFSKKKPIFLNPEQESETKIAFADIPLDKDQKVNADYLSVKENYSFSVKKQNEVNFVTTSPLQIISLATSLIPFVEHNDANRALMGSNMQRQAVPLIYSQKPIIGTGLEATAILDSGMVVKNYCEGTVVHSSGKSIIVEDLANQKISYFLRKYYRSNQETSINQRPIVWSGETVFSGQIIADGPSTNDGELSLGRNLTIGYMPWEGYNYEDAIVINERIIYDDCLTSIHIEEHETSLSYSVTGSEKLTSNLPHLTKYIRRHLDSEGIVRIGSYVKEHDILVGKLTPCEEDTSPEAKLVKALYGQKKPSFRDTSLRVAHGTEGRVIDVRIISTNLLTKDEPSFPTFCEIIRIYIAQVRKIQVGDKLAGRHGNKGIISRILPRQDMPYLPDGTPIDIIFNPLGVPSRMNVGQVLECLLGLAGEKLGNRFKVSPFDEIYGKEASRVLVNQKLKEAALKTNNKWLFNIYSPGKILLRDGRTGEYFDNPITVGKSYILKLIHLVEDKIHARATGPYSMITEQPLAGKSQKGGQRFGEMEVWALEAYGCSNTLQELLTIKSDDIDGRNDMYEAILVRKKIDKPSPSIPESFLALIRELEALGLQFSMQKVEKGFSSTTDIHEIEKDIFQELEIRLKLRALLARKKAEEFAKSDNVLEELDPYLIQKEIEKRKILERLIYEGKIKDKLQNETVN